MQKTDRHDGPSKSRVNCLTRASTTTSAIAHRIRRIAVPATSAFSTSQRSRHASGKAKNCPGRNAKFARTAENLVGNQNSQETESGIHLSHSIDIVSALAMV
jgi:hypothetical protein